MAYPLVHNLHFHLGHLVAQVAFRAKAAFLAQVQPVLVEVRWFLFATSVPADSLLYYYGMEGSHPFDLYKPFPGVFLSQPSLFYAQETQLLISSVLGLWREVSKIVVSFLLLRRAEAVLSTLWRFSRQNACRSDLAVPNLLATP
jgi:hypothetical protein